MKSNEVVKTIENLDLIYKKANSTSSRKIFFISIIEYIDFLYKNQSLKILWDLINRLRDEDEDLKEFNKAKEEAERKIKAVFNKVKEFINKNNIEDPFILEEIERFESLEKGTLAITGDEISFKYKCVSGILFFLLNQKNKDYLEFCRGFGEISDEFTVKEWYFNKNLLFYEENLSKIGRVKYIKPWFSFDKLNEFYSVFKDVEKMKLEAYRSNKIFDLWGYGLLANDIKIILSSNESEQPKFIKKEDYEFYFTKLHSFIKQTLEIINRKLNEKTDNKKWFYDKDKAVLFIDGKEVKFKKDKFRGKLMELLTKNEKNQKKEWNWDEIIIAIEAIEEPDIKYKNKVFEAGRDINEYIASKTGKTDFLVVSTQTISINKKYLS